MSLLEDIGLSNEQKHAVIIIEQFIIAYNSKEGIGLFSGMARYEYLEDRARIAAIQSSNIIDFWSRLREKLGCSLPPKRCDDVILETWINEEPHKVLKVIATQASECVMIARMIIEQNKSSLRG